MTEKSNNSVPERILDFDLSSELNHGIVVSNLAYDVAKALGLEEKICYELAIAGMLMTLASSG